MRGFWDVEGDFMGGPFVSYTTVDTATDRVFTLDCYVYSPKLPKRNYMREVEHLLHLAAFAATGSASATVTAGRREAGKIRCSGIPGRKSETRSNLVGILIIRRPGVAIPDISVHRHLYGDGYRHHPGCHFGQPQPAQDDPVGRRADFRSGRGIGFLFLLRAGSAAQADYFAPYLQAARRSMLFRPMCVEAMPPFRPHVNPCPLCLPILRRRFPFTAAA